MLPHTSLETFGLWPLQIWLLLAIRPTEKQETGPNCLYDNANKKLIHKKFWIKENTQIQFGFPNIECIFPNKCIYSRKPFQCRSRENIQNVEVAFLVLKLQHFFYLVYLLNFTFFWLIFKFVINDISGSVTLAAELVAFSIVQYNTVKSCAECCTVIYSTVRYSKLQHSTLSVNHK